MPAADLDLKALQTYLTGLGEKLTDLARHL